MWSHSSAISHHQTIPKCCQYAIYHHHSDCHGGAVQIVTMAVSSLVLINVLKYWFTDLLWSLLAWPAYSSNAQDADSVIKQLSIQSRNMKLSNKSEGIRNHRCTASPNSTSMGKLRQICNIRSCTGTVHWIHYLLYSVCKIILFTCQNNLVYLNKNI